MANQPFKPESLDAALDVLSLLKDRAADAEKRGDAFTFSLMCQLVKVVSPIVTKAHARMIREERADLNDVSQNSFPDSQDKFRGMIAL
jgi:hypothetical protein